MGLITSQNATAPKPMPGTELATACLITSQNATAPKRHREIRQGGQGLITSQNATAPKHVRQRAARPAQFDYQSECHCSKTSTTSPRTGGSLITSQNATAPKRSQEDACRGCSLITSQNATAPKPMEQVSPCKENGHPAGKHLSALKKVLVNNHFILECIGIHVGIIFQHEHA